MILIGNYVIDAVLTENHELSADVSEFPIEDGATITDHVRVRSKRYRMQGVVSNTPLTSGFRSIEPDGTEIALDGAFADQARVALEQLLRDRKPMRLVTAACTYDNMVMESLSFSKDVDTDNALVFDAAFVQITVVTNRRLRVDIKFKAVDRGNQTTTIPGWLVDAGAQVVESVLGPFGVSVKPGAGARFERDFKKLDGKKIPKAEVDASVRGHGREAPSSARKYQPNTPKQRKPLYAPSKRRGI